MNMYLTLIHKRAAKQLFDVEAYTAVDLSEHMLNIAEQLESKQLDENI